MASALYQILEWAKSTGEVRAVERIRLKVLTASLDEGIALQRVGPDTPCSQAYLAKVHAAASDVVGQLCPIAISGSDRPTAERRK
jgi:hypothetical protein